MSIVNRANVGVADPVFQSRPDVDKAGLDYQHDSAVVHDIEPSFQEYLYWADLRRAAEDKLSPTTSTSVIGFFKRKNNSQNSQETQVQTIKSEKNGTTVTSENGVADYDELAGLSPRAIELSNARRVLRLASWSNVFYLITCDILGPFSAPYAISQIGLVPGVILYTLFGVVAGITGIMLSKIFCRLDSVRYPIRSYGDLGQRLLGPWARHLFSFLQTVQLIINVGLIVLTNGQSLSQITKGGLCFSVCIVIWAFVGMVVGQIRTLKNFALLANSTVWINLLIIFLSMGFVAHSPPNYASAFSTYGYPEGPVIVSATLPGQALFVQVNGVFNMVFAFGGAMIFPEILSEMRRPRDFVKGMVYAQLLIFTAYIFYGVFIYCFQGQFTLPVSYQGVSKYAWQTITNVLALITGIIAAGLYGNIGLKVLYINIVEGLFRGPPMMSRKGRYLWSTLIVIYWSLAFVVGSAIPAVGALSGLIAAMAIFHFTYTFPPLLMLALDMRLDASLADEPFQGPGTVSRQIDNWSNPSRWIRGFTAGGRKRVIWKSMNVLFLIAALATDALGLWATGTDLKSALEAGAATSFGCAAPV